MKSYPPERLGITLLIAPEGSPNMNVSLIRSEGFKFHRVINNNNWLLHHIETYINTRSMTFNSLMTLCKHGLAWPAHSKITKAACLPSRPPRPNIWESSQGSLGSPDKYWCLTDAGLWTKLLMGGGQESWAEHKLSLILFFVYVAYLSILILLWKQVKEMF